MSARRAAPLCAAWVALALAGCRADPGLPTYVDDAMPTPVRLSVGAFYNGPATDVIAIDDSGRRFDVFSGSLSFIYIDNRDRIDGQPATVLTHAGTAFWGMGIDWDSAIDLSRWKTMHVAFKSSSAAFATFQVTMNSGTPYPLDAAAYGWRNDGNWHTMAIPVADFVKLGFAPAMTKSPFSLGGGPGSAGETIKVAGLYFDEAG